MRPETIPFPDGVPVRALFLGDVAYPYHWHHALEIIWVMKGQVQISLGGRTVMLAEGDLVVVNCDQPHRITKGDGENRLIMVQMDASFCQQVSPNYTVIYCCSAYHSAQAAQKYAALKGLLGRLICLLTDDLDEQQPAAVRKHLTEVLSYLVNNFDYLRFGAGNKAFEEKQTARFRSMYQQIISAPYRHYGLKEFADAAGVTLQHLSNDIKGKFGHTFQELLACCRCEHAARLLLSTDCSISEVTSTCAFSDPKYLIKHFKLNYQCTPSEFRKQHRADDQALEAQLRYRVFPLSSALRFVK